MIKKNIVILVLIASLFLGILVYSPTVFQLIISLLAIYISFLVLNGSTDQNDQIKTICTVLLTAAALMFISNFAAHNYHLHLEDHQQEDGSGGLLPKLPRIGGSSSFEE